MKSKALSGQGVDAAKDDCISNWWSAFRRSSCQAITTGTRWKGTLVCSAPDAMRPFARRDWILPPASRRKAYRSTEIDLVTGQEEAMTPMRAMLIASLVSALGLSGILCAGPV